MGRGQERAWSGKRQKEDRRPQAAMSEGKGTLAQRSKRRALLPQSPARSQACIITATT